MRPHYGWNTAGESEDGFTGRFRTRAAALRAGQKIEPGVAIYTARLEWVDLAAALARALCWEDAVSLAADDEEVMIDYLIGLDDVLAQAVEPAIRRVLRAHADDINAWRAVEIRRHEPAEAPHAG